MRYEKNVVPLCSQIDMVDIAQLVRASDCGSEGRGFESRFPPEPQLSTIGKEVFIFIRFVLGNHVLKNT